MPPMKMPKRLMAGLGLLVLSASPLLHAEDQIRGEDHDRGGYDQRGGPEKGPDPRNMHRPPQDFGPIRLASTLCTSSQPRPATPPSAQRPHAIFASLSDPQKECRREQEDRH